MEQYMPIVWVGFAIFMLLCEGFTTQLVSIWFVLGSVCAAITTIFTSDITIQSAVFLVVSLVSLIVTRPLVKRFKKRNKTTGTNADRHIGQVGFMLTDLTDIDKTAQAKVGAETWTVKSDKAPLLKGTKVKVLAIEGVKLIVEPISEWEVNNVRTYYFRYHPFNPAYSNCKQCQGSAAGTRICNWKTRNISCNMVNRLACKNSVYRQNFKESFIKRAGNRLPSTAWSE